MYICKQNSLDRLLGASFRQLLNRMKRLLFLFCLLPFLLGSCARYRYFTKSNKASLESAGIPIKNTQFYIDRRLQLRRVISSEDAKVTEGKIRFVDGEYISIAYMRRKTPGVIENVDGNKFVVKFENGTGRTFSFQCSQKEVFNYFKVGPVKRPNIAQEREVFSIVADDYKLLHGRRYEAKMKYEDKDYALRFRTHHWTHYFGQAPYLPTLLVRRDRFFNFRIVRRRIRGKRVA